MKDFSEQFTVVVCCRNSINTIEKCLKNIIDSGAKNIVIIDGNSQDGTQERILSLGFEFMPGKGLGLSADRQYGIDLVKTQYTFFIDSDHLIEQNFYEQMIEEYLEKKVDFIQSRLRISNPINLMNKGEDDYYVLFHNTHWNKKMIGLAPALFRTQDLKTGAVWQLFSSTAKVIDDTSWAKRSSDAGATFAVTGPEVLQVHTPNLSNYLKKFYWYGKGDGDFILEFPSRANSMIFHLSIRYPILFGLKMLSKGKFSGFIFVFVQGYTRFFSCILRIVTQYFVNKI